MAGSLSTNYLDPIVWGTSTGGAASTAETTSTIGQDPLDFRVPPDQYHVSNLQIARIRQLCAGMSTTFKGGTRLGVLTQTANPFGASESGFYISTAGTGYVVFNGTPTAIGGGGGGTTQTIDVINATAATGKTYTAAVADSSTNVAHIFNNSTALTSGRKLASFQNNGTEYASIDVSAVSTDAATLSLRNSAGTAMISLSNSSGSGTSTIASPSGIFKINTGGYLQITAASGVVPITDLSAPMGVSSLRWSAVNARDYFVGAAGGAGLGSGSGVLSISNAVTLPSTNPSAGGVLYADAGALKWRGSSGTVTTIAPA
jgi:hypothetical protein